MNATTQPQPSAALWPQLAAFGVAYWILAWIGSLVSIPAINFVTFWLPSGLYVGALLAFPDSRRFAVAATAFAANVAFDLAHGQSLGTALGFSAINTFEAVLGSVLVRRWVNPAPTCDSVRDVLGVIGLASLGATALASLLGAAAASTDGDRQPYLVHWILWWTASAAGSVIIAPLTIAWTRGRCPVGGRLTPGRLFEGIGLAVAVLLVSHLTIRGEWEDGHRLTYLVLPVVGWAAIRFGTRGAALATLIVAATFAWHTAHLALPSPVTTSAVLRQIAVVHTFVIVLGLAGLLLAAVIEERRIAEERLRESEAKARALMETPNSYAILLSPGGEVLDASRTVGTALRRQVSELIGRPLWPVLPEDLASSCQSVVARCLVTREPIRVESQIAGHWFDFLVSPVPDANGRPRSVSLVAWDITRQKKREREFQRLTLLHACLSLVNRAIVRVTSPEELHRRVCESLVDHGPFSAVVIASFDPLTGQLECVAQRDRDTAAEASLPGWETVTGSVVREGRTARSRTEGEPAIEIAGVPIRTGGQTRGVLCVRAGDATPFNEQEIGVLEQAALEISFGLEHLRHESERDLADRALRESELRFRQFFDTLDDHGFMVAPDGIILDANRAALTALEGSHDEIIGALLPSIYAPEHRDLIRGAWSRSASGEEIRGLELSLIRPSGERRHVQVNIVPVRNEAGEVMLAAVVQTDTTERRQMGDQLRQAQKMEAIGQLAGGVAHDFNNVLAAIMVHLGLIKANARLDAGTREIVEELEVEAKRAAGMTRQLLLFSRRSVMQVRILDLNEVVENLLKMLRRLLGEHIRLEWHAAGALPKVEGDAGMLEQVVMNLVVNARDAMPGGGRLTISTQVVDISEAQAACSPEARPGRHVILDVEDTGAGIDGDTLKHLFEPFFTTKASGLGTGLGLATVYGIVRQHRGWLDVQTRLGEGSLFRVHLPASLKPSQGPLRAPVPTEVRGGTETILLVEDEPSVRRAAAHCLRLFGYRVFEAANGADATTLWNLHRDAIHLLAADMVLPGEWSGLALARRFRAEKPNLVVIVSTGYSTDRGGGTEAPAHDVVYLAKPYEASVLGATVRAALDNLKPTER